MLWRRNCESFCFLLLKCVTKQMICLLNFYSHFTLPDYLFVSYFTFQVLTIEFEMLLVLFVSLNNYRDIDKTMSTLLFTLNFKPLHALTFATVNASIVHDQTLPIVIIKYIHMTIIDITFITSTFEWILNGSWSQIIHPLLSFVISKHKYTNIRIFLSVLS